MALTKAFYEAVQSGNIRRVRIMMKDSLIVDTSFKEFEEMKTAASSMNGLYDIHDNREFITDKSKWNDDYMNRLLVQLVNNFSHERITHLKNVIRQLHPMISTAKSTSSATNKARTTATDKSSTAQRKTEQHNYTSKNAKLATGTVAGVVAGAVVGGVVAAAAGITVIGGSVAGAVLGGVVGTFAVSGGNKND